MTCPSPGRWDLWAVGALTTEESEPLLDHARVCTGCRERYAAARGAHIERLRMYEAFEYDHDERREQLMAALPDDLSRRERAPRLAQGVHRLGDYVMRLRKSKSRWVAVALLPTACVILVVTLFVTAGAEVAFASVLEQMRAARTMVCDVNITTTSEFDFDPRFAEKMKDGGHAVPTGQTSTTRGTMSMYSDGVTRAWLLVTDDPPQRQLTLPDRMIVTEDGRHRVTMHSEAPDGQGFAESPERWLRRLLDVTDEPDRELGRSVIAGRKVAGFEIAASRLGMPTGGSNDPGSSVVEVWVDVETRLPKRLVFNVTSVVGPGVCHIEGTWDNMRWDEPLKPQQFEPPETTEVDEVRDSVVPPPTEASLLAGLRAYAEQSEVIAEVMAAAEQKAKRNPGGDVVLEQMREWFRPDSIYPATLDMNLAMQVAMRSSMLRAQLIARRQHFAQTAGEEAAAERFAAEEAELKRRCDEVHKWAGSAAAFYRNLVMNGREPEYFGDSVTPDDDDKVLLRWKRDDGQLRVLYGDLRVETVSTP